MDWLWIWLIIIVISLIFELVTVGLVTIWITGGALGALLVSVVGGPVWLQLAVFFILTGILLFFTRPLAVKYINKRRTDTNVDAMKGVQVRVLEEVNNQKETGKALYNGMEWTARAMDGEDIFSVDEMATVHEVSGVKLILEKNHNK